MEISLGTKVRMGGQVGTVCTVFDFHVRMGLGADHDKLASIGHEIAIVEFEDRSKGCIQMRYRVFDAQMVSDKMVEIVKV